MGLLDALRGLTRPYDEDEDFFDDEEELLDEEETPVKSSSRAGSNSFFGTDTPEYDAPEAEEAPVAAAPISRPAFMSRRPREQEQRSSRMPAPQSGGNKIVFVKPERYEDTKMVYDHLRSRRIVLMSLDETTHEGFNDLHMLFGTMCALAELQSAFPGRFLTDKPLKLVLDRRPFI